MITRKNWSCGGVDGGGRWVIGLVEIGKREERDIGERSYFPSKDVFYLFNLDYKLFIMIIVFLESPTWYHQQ